MLSRLPKFIGTDPIFPYTTLFRLVGGVPREPVWPPRARRIDEQRRSDLDDQARAGGGREKRHVAADSARGAARQCEYRGSESRNFLSTATKAPARALCWPPFPCGKWMVGWTPFGWGVIIPSFALPADRKCAVWGKG